MMGIGPDAMGTVQRAAEKLKSVLTPAQRERLSKAME